MSKSYLEVEGTYDNSRRFAFTNITDEDFTSNWDGQPTTVKSGMTKELPHHLAVKMTIELVDKIMIGLATIGGQKTENRGIASGVPESRKVWEDKILRELTTTEESPEIALMRAQIRKEIEAENVKKEEVKEVKNKEEFPDLKEISADGTSESKEILDESKGKTILSEIKKRGRPAKIK